MSIVDVEVRSLLRRFLAGSITVADLHEALSRAALGEDSALVDEVIGVLFADGEGADSDELRERFSVLVWGEMVPAPAEEGRLARVPGATIFGFGGTAARTSTDSAASEDLHTAR